eukprot:3039303-Pyramimonas_sp.AAC.2
MLHSCLTQRSRLRCQNKVPSFLRVGFESLGRSNQRSDIRRLCRWCRAGMHWGAWELCSHHPRGNAVEGTTIVFPRHRAWGSDPPFYLIRPTCRAGRSPDAHSSRQLCKLRCFGQ